MEIARTESEAPESGAAVAAPPEGDATDLFRELFDKLYSRLLILKRGPLDPEEAQDALQSAFLALQQRRRTDGFWPKSPADWLLRVAVNQARKAWSMRRRFASLDATVPPSPREPCSAAVRAASLLVRAELGCAVWKALRDLPSEARLIVELHVLEDMTFPAIARRLCVNMERVKKACRRALLRIRERLDRYASRPDEARPSSSPLLRPGDRFRGYVVLERIGRGGMSDVYLTRDETHGRFVALKVLRSASRGALDRLRREARIDGLLRHPGIADVYAAGRHAGRSYVAMRFIDGEPIDRTPRPIPAQIALVRDAARAVHHAHGRGIVHLDVKPANLLVDREGRVHVTDFGLAREIRCTGRPSIPLLGTVVGTPEFMSPEQARGDASTIGFRSDVYGLGATLYALLAGRPPFVRESLGDLLMHVIRGRPAPLTQINPLVSPELRLLVERAMARDPAERFASAAEFADELDVFSAE
ncbi:MAG: sigma-70 family RNA polymerase sigma factor [Planctomycetes bacterium]|nr:sigma-70 family RNA polymerase sigma factor [Planctomycetota bacterium]